MYFGLTGVDNSWGNQTEVEKTIHRIYETYHRENLNVIRGRVPITEIYGLDHLKLCPSSSDQKLFIFYSNPDDLYFSMGLTITQAIQAFKSEIKMETWDKIKNLPYDSYSFHKLCQNTSRFKINN